MQRVYGGRRPTTVLRLALVMSTSFVVLVLGMFATVALTVSRR